MRRYSCPVMFIKDVRTVVRQERGVTAVHLAA